MLIGSPGTKKSSAIKIGAKLLKTAGYTTFAAKKTRQEKFLLDLAEQSEDLDGPGTDILDTNLWGDDSENPAPGRADGTRRQGRRDRQEPGPSGQRIDSPDSRDRDDPPARARPGQGVPRRPRRHDRIADASPAHDVRQDAPPRE